MDIAPGWIAAAALLGIACACAIAEHRQRKRHDLDRIGMVNWVSLQLLALMAAMLVAAFTFANR